MIPVSIPSPPLDWQVLLSIGPFDVHVYALAILTGIVVAVAMARRRWVARGGSVSDLEEIAVWAIPLGIIGGRLYHVISSPAAYFGKDGHPIDALKIWQGGLGIWGAVALGAVGAYIGARRVGVSFSAFMDVAAPGVLIAQAIGRIGNYFNQELFGAPTTLPWGLEISPYSPNFPQDYQFDTTFHPTFLYEMIWNVVGAIIILRLDKKYLFRHGRMFWAYVIAYTTGRLWIEMVRIDTAVHIAGLRVNVWVAGLVLLLGVVMFVVTGYRFRGEPPTSPAVVNSAARLVAPNEASAAGTSGAAAPATTTKPAKAAKSPTTTKTSSTARASATSSTSATPAATSAAPAKKPPAKG